MFAKTFLFLALLSVVSSQTFFNERRRSVRPFRSSGNFRRFQDDGALGENGGSGVSYSSQLTDENGQSLGGSEQAVDGEAGGSTDGASDDAALDGGDAALEPVNGDSAADGGAITDGGPSDTAGDAADTPLTDRDSDEPGANIVDDAAAGGVARPPPPSTDHGSRDEEEHDPNDLTWLRNAIRGEPDQDYPILAEVPKTGFRCGDQQYAGYYGDPEARCQVFHICQKPDNRMDSFLCPNGTIFSQRNFVCVWWWQYDCSQTEKDYALNANLYSEGGSDYQNNQLQQGGPAGDGADGDSYGSTGTGDEVTEAPALGGVTDTEAGFTDTSSDENGLTAGDGGGDVPATDDVSSDGGTDTPSEDNNGALGGTADGYAKTNGGSSSTDEPAGALRGSLRLRGSRRGRRVSSLRRSRSRSTSRRRSLSRRRGSSRSRSRSARRRSSTSSRSRRRSLRRSSSSRRRRTSRRAAIRRSSRRGRRVSRHRN